MRAPFLALLLALSLLAEDPKPLPQGASLDIYIVEVEGEVDVQFAPKEAWMPAVKGAKLAVGSKVMSGIGGKAVLAFGSNSVAQVDEATSFEIRSFGMQGDKLVANVYIDPGVAHVALKQLAQFQTDFQVSTPRLTCSVRGSKMDVSSEGDELPDRTQCTEDRAYTDQANGQQRILSETEQTNSENDSNQQIVATDNLSDTTPEGATEQETTDENLLSQNAGSIDLNVSDATVNTDPSPSGDTGGGGQTPPPAPPPCDPALVAADEQFLTDHGLNALVFFLQTGDAGHRQPAQDDWDSVNEQLTAAPIFVDKHDAIHRLVDCSPFGGQLEDHHGIVTLQERDFLRFTTDLEDVTSHVGEDARTNFNGGFEDPAHSDANLYAQRNGYTAFVNDVFIPYLQGRFNADPQNYQVVDPALFVNIQLNLFNNAGGLTDLAATLQNADAESKFDAVYTPFAQDILLQMVQKEFEISQVEKVGNTLPQYQNERDNFLVNPNGELAQLRNEPDFDHFLAHFGVMMIDGWKDATGVRERPNPGDFGFDGRQHLNSDLIGLLEDVRAMTFTQGVMTPAERAEGRVFVSLDQLRHHANPGDIVDTEGIDIEAQFENSAVALIGVKGSVDVFEVEGLLDDLQKDLRNNPLFGPGDDSPGSLFDQRLTDFKDQNNFGLDALASDWGQAADQARVGQVDSHLFGHAIIATARADRFKEFFGEPGGSVQIPGQFEIDRANLQSLVNNLHQTLDTSGYNAFLTQFESQVHQRYHDQNGIPLNPRPNDPGLAAHQAFHAALDEFDAGAHAAVAPPQ